MSRRRRALGSVPIAKAHVGVERCVPFNKQTRICVYGAKYGFSAWLTSNAGNKLAPISINARSPREALDQAMRSAKRTVGRNN